MTEKVHISYLEELEELISQEDWILSKHERNSWWSFTRPDQRHVAFGIMSGTQGEVYLYIKRVHKEANTFPIKATNYSQEWDQDEYLIEPGVTKLSFLAAAKAGLFPYLIWSLAFVLSAECVWARTSSIRWRGGVEHNRYPWFSRENPLRHPQRSLLGQQNLRRAAIAKLESY